MISRKKNTLSGLVVGEAMRKQVIRLPSRTPIAKSINALIKYKINALLTTDEEDLPVGVVSKTDIMSAYYAGLPVDSALENIMSSPPLFISPAESLELALEKMRSKKIYRLYVTDSKTGEVIGALAYPDIVGLLYQFCSRCEFSHFGKKPAEDTIRRYRVKELMTADVKSVVKFESLTRVMEELSMYRFGAILIRDIGNVPCGVISKTDLTLTYKHGVDPNTPAETIMSSPVRTCEENELLEDAIREMIFTDVHRLFIHKVSPGNIVGVLSLSDAARIRSGSCHACLSSQINIDEHN